MGWRGLVAGALGLIFLEVVVSSGSGRVGGLLSSAGAIAQRFLSPAVPAFAKPIAAKDVKPDLNPQTGKPRVISYPLPGLPAGQLS